MPANGPPQRALMLHSMAQETVCSAGLKALRRSFTPSPEVDILYVESYSRDSNCIALMIEKQTQDVSIWKVTGDDDVYFGGYRSRCMPLVPDR